MTNISQSIGRNAFLPVGGCVFGARVSPLLAIWHISLERFPYVFFYSHCVVSLLPTQTILKLHYMVALKAVWREWKEWSNSRRKEGREEEGGRKKNMFLCCPVFFLFCFSCFVLHACMRPRKNPFFVCLFFLSILRV